MSTLSYVLSTVLLATPFVGAGVVEAAYNKLFLQRGTVLDLANATFPAGNPSFTLDPAFHSVFLFNETTFGQCYLIGTRNPNVFLATDLVVPGPPPVPTSLNDYSNRFEVRFTGAGTSFDIFHGNTNVGSGDFSSVGSITYLNHQNILYQYNYGEWLAVFFVFVFLVEIFRLLYKQITISNVLEATRKFRIRKRRDFISTDYDDTGGLSIFTFLARIINAPGYILSFILFPRSTLSYYLGLILLIGTYVVSFILFLSTGDPSAEVRTFYGVFTGLVFAIYIYLRFRTDFY